MGTVPPAPTSAIRAGQAPAGQAPAGHVPAGHAPGSDNPAAVPAPFAGTPIGQPATTREAKLNESYRSKNVSTVELSKASRLTRGGQAAVNSPRPDMQLRRGRAMTPGLQANAPDFGLPIDEGRGPGIAGDRFDPITDNAFKRVSEHPLSTFSVDVDTASYSKTRDYLIRQNSLPRPDAVRIEELVNYFDYEYEPPMNDAEHPFATTATLMSCPWNEEHRLARIALKGKTMEKEERPRCNLVFLLDTSGSMNAANKLPLVIEGMKMLISELDPKDQVAITVYAGSAGLVLDSTSAKKSKKIRQALTELSAGGSTNGGAGIALAYQTARDNFITDGVNRVILCTDGDFNVGTTGTDALVRMVEKEAKGGIFLSVLGFGMGNHNDAMLEKISGRGNGNYAFIDTREEARKVLVDQTSGTLVTIAKDVKLQIEFNPNQISSYRLIGYENRVLAKEDFKNDKVDAGEIGAGHTVTALYEIVPAGVEADAAFPAVDDLKYQERPKPTKAADSGESMTLKLRYKQPEGSESTEIEIPIKDDELDFQDADHDARFAAAVAGFGMQLRRSKYAGNWTLDDVIRVAKDATGEDEYGIRAEFISLAERARSLTAQE
jgi:Ca-activated chloride channel family protein